MVETLKGNGHFPWLICLSKPGFLEGGLSYHTLLFIQHVLNSTQQSSQMCSSPWKFQCHLPSGHNGMSNLLL